MAKHTELYLRLVELVHSGEQEGQQPAEVVDNYPDFRAMHIVTFRSKFREIRRMKGEPYQMVGLRLLCSEIISNIFQLRILPVMLFAMILT